MRSLPEEEFFVTTLNGSLGKIYPRSVWDLNQKTLQSHKTNQRAAADLARYADHHGSLATIDSQSRILLSPQLRRKLGIENQPCHLRYYNDVIEIYSEAELEASLTRAEAATETLDALYAEGLK